jgi:ABC-type nitrate/sulfonate/bicarbonate transport system permease component
MFLPVLLFSLFALLSALGAYLVFARQRGRTAGLWAAAATVLFFGVLFAGLLALLRDAGL